MYAAKAGAMQLHWSQLILDEMSRNLIAKFGFSPDNATELELRLTEYLPRALIEYAGAIPRLWPTSRWMIRIAT